MNEREVADYLLDNPDFFAEHAELLGTIRLSNPHGKSAVSLQERQMEMLRDKNKQLERRKARVRRTIKAVSGGRLRLSVFRSSKHIYAQVIDDRKGATVASASSLEKEMRTTLKTGADTDAAKAVGKLVAERAAAAGVKDVVFDRGNYLLHGRVKALANAAREGGLNF